MTTENDRIAEELQESIFEGLSTNLMNEVLNSRNIGRIDKPDSYVSVTGICGDTIEMFLNVTDGRINDLKFVTDGCGFTIACASYVTRMAVGRTVEGALLIRPENVDNYFGGLPEEHKHCAKLSVMTLEAVIENYRGKSKRPS